MIPQPAERKKDKAQVGYVFGAAGLPPGVCHPPRIRAFPLTVSLTAFANWPKPDFSPVPPNSNS